MLVASTVTVLVASSTIGLINSLTGAQRRIESEMELHAEARAAVRAIESALRNAIQVAPKNELLLEGVDMEEGGVPMDRIRFRTRSLRTIRTEQPESDWREVEFFVMPPDENEDAAATPGSPGGGAYPTLYRRSDPTRNLDPDMGGVLERIAQRVGALDIEYHDGEQWLPEWLPDQREWPLAIRFNVAVLGGELEEPVVWSSRRTVGYYVPQDIEPRGEENALAGGGK
jgi:hypothetical protein